MGTAGASVYPGGSNGYIPGSTDLVVAYSRNPKDFPLLQYTQLLDIPDGKDITHYLKFGREEMARLQGGEDFQFNWAEGDPRPDNYNTDEAFNWVKIKTQRKSFPYVGGQKSNSMSAVPMQSVRRTFMAQRAMTSRVSRVHAQLELAGNWETGHSKDVATISGNSGRWDQSTTQRSDIKRSLTYAAEQIMLSTFSVVKQEDLVLVCNPTTARKLGVSQEFVSHLIQSPEAKNHLTGQGYKPSGLLGNLFGYEIICEDTVQVTNNRGGTAARSFVCANDVVYMLARPGGISVDALEGPSFSTIGIFVYEDMTDETETDKWNRIEKGAITDDVVPEMVSSVSGFRMLNVTG